MQIGEVADRTGLSLRTIRHYEEVGLVPPSARSKGGFRLYTEADVERLLLVRRMKPLDFTLEEMRDLLALLDQLDADDHPRRAVLIDRLSMYHEVTTQRIDALRDQLTAAETFAGELRAQITRHTRPRRRRGEPERPR